MTSKNTPQGDRNWKVLVVEDSLPDRILLQEHFRDAGLNVTLDEAESGQQCWEMLQTQSYDCVFIDYILHDTDGLEIIKKLKHTNKNTALVLFTGHRLQGLRARALQLGATHVLSKDEINPEKLVKVLTENLKQQSPSMVWLRRSADS